jgi:hypothetical protein
MRMFERVGGGPKFLLRGSQGISQRKTLSSIGPALDVDPKREGCEVWQLSQASSPT